MATAMDVAKVFIKHGMDRPRNTYEGNMKIQKMLFFANLVSLCEFSMPLFDDDILAFENGCVVEKVRLRYRNDYNSLFNDSQNFAPDFTQVEYDAVDLTEEIFGNSSAQELSELSHTFTCWQKSFTTSWDENNFKHKDWAVISKDAMKNEANRIRVIINSYKINAAIPCKQEIINGVKFSFDPQFKVTDDVLKGQEKFSHVAEEDAYSVYMDNGKMVVY